MEEKIKTLAEQIIADVQTLRSTLLDESAIIGVEVMALNACVNAARFLDKGKTAEKSSGLEP